jgi:hypothetical protein
MSTYVSAIIHWWWSWGFWHASSKRPVIFFFPLLSWSALQVVRKGCFLADCKVNQDSKVSKVRNWCRHDNFSSFCFYQKLLGVGRRKQTWALWDKTCSGLIVFTCSIPKHVSPTVELYVVLALIGQVGHWWFCQRSASVLRASCFTLHTSALSALTLLKQAIASKLEIRNSTEW